MLLLHTVDGPLPEPPPQLRHLLAQRPQPMIAELKVAELERLVILDELPRAEDRCLRWS